MTTGRVAVTYGPGEPWCIDESEAVFRAGLERSFGDDVRRLAEEYFALQRAMLGAEPIAFVGHLDRIKIWNAGNAFFREDEPWYVTAVEETLRVVAASGIPIELNTRGWYRYGRSSRRWRHRGWRRRSRRRSLHRRDRSRW